MTNFCRGRCKFLKVVIGESTAVVGARYCRICDCTFNLHFTHCQCCSSLLHYIDKDGVIWRNITRSEKEI